MGCVLPVSFLFPRQKSIRYMFQLVLVVEEVNDHHIKAYIPVQAIFPKIGICCFGQEFLFPSGNHSSRSDPVSSNTCFDLHHYQEATFFGKYVYLFFSEVPVAIQYAKTLFLKIMGSQPFSPAAQLGFIIGIFHNNFETFIWGISNKVTRAIEEQNYANFTKKSMPYRFDYVGCSFLRTRV